MIQYDNMIFFSWESNRYITPAAESTNNMTQRLQANEAAYNWCKKITLGDDSVGDSSLPVQSTCASTEMWTLYIDYH